MKHLVMARRQRRYNLQIENVICRTIELDRRGAKAISVLRRAVFNCDRIPVPVEYPTILFRFLNRLLPIATIDTHILLLDYDIHNWHIIQYQNTDT